MSVFQVVRSKKKGRRSKCINNIQLGDDNGLTATYSNEFDKKICENQISSCKNELAASQFLNDLYSLLLHCCSCEDATTCNLEQCHKDFKFEEIVVYGIGSLCNSSIARYQFSLVLALLERIKIKCYLYDPVLTADEKSFIETHGIILIKSNEECKRKVSTKNLFIMLHCGKSMYNNLLWSNWGFGLENITILGNCFSSYVDRIPARELAESSKYLNNIIPHTMEHIVKNSFHHDDVFNDTAVHTFPRTKLLEVSNEVWLDNCEPANCCDSEIIGIDKEF